MFSFARLARYATRSLLLAILLLLLVRLFTLGLYPLVDATESRYGDIVRRILQGNEWITLFWFDGRPFLAKPPLAFWLSALSSQWLGLSEFALRLPHWLLGSGAIALIAWQAKQLYGARVALHASAYLGSGFVFFIANGVMFTDMALMFGTTLTMLGFYQCVLYQNTLQTLNHSSSASTRFHVCQAQIMFFLGLAIGFLAKGPVTIVLCALPIGGWTLYYKKLAYIWSRIAWAWGTLAVAVMVLPWFILLETRQPGFLHYYFVGEHWLRFLTPGWEGNLYGNAHLEPRGMIGFFLWLALLPWSVLIPLSALLHWLANRNRARKSYAITMNVMIQHDALMYWLVWSVSGVLFFGFARNIEIAYVLPLLPSIAILCALYSASRKNFVMIDFSLAAILVFESLFFVSLFHYFMQDGYFERRSTQWLVTLAKQTSTQSPIWYVGDMPASTAYYSEGSARPIAIEQARTIKPFCPSAMVIVPDDVQWDPEAQTLYQTHITRIDATQPNRLHEHKLYQIQC